MDELLGDFLTETVESLAAIDDALVRWERDPADRATLDAIFRLVHTIKGTCGFLDLPRLEALAHAAETVLGRVRDGKLVVSTSLVTEVLAAIDGIRAVVAALGANGVEPAGDDAVQISRLQNVAEGIELASESTEPEGPVEAQGAQTIRVPVTLLERLMDTVSELVLARNQLTQLSRAGHSPETLGIQFARLSQCISVIQESVMRTRMQPVERVWASLPRLVRRLSLDLGKRVAIDFAGGDVELDRQMLEVVKDPLAHMVRNAAGHGLETPAQRRAAGKDETGRIRIEAAQEGGQIVIQLSDDGRGLDLIRLRSEAVSRGLMSDRDAARLSNADAARLIFLPGLSTADEITAVSGRGVGMDVVKANLEKIGGSVDVDTTVGRGTRFALRIPLTLAIVPALVIAARGQRFAIPQMTVAELLQVGGDGPKIERTHDALVLRTRDGLLPLVDLGALLGLAECPEAEERFVVVAQAAGFRYGLVIDELFDTEEIVVKPVSPLLSALSSYSGNTVLGDGTVAMILDIGGLAAIAGLGATSETDAVLIAEAEAPRGALLLFRTESAALMAVPLAQVQRIEDLPSGAIEHVGGRALVQYRGGLMPVIGIEGPAAPRATRQPLLVINDGAHSAGFPVESVEDIVEDTFERSPTDRPGRLCNIVVGGRIAEMLDVRHYLAQVSAISPAALDRAA